MIRRSCAGAVLAVFVLLLSTGCGVDSVTADAGVGPGEDGSAPNGDAAPTSGLTIDFRSKPKLPPHGDGEVGGAWDAQIDAATIVLRDVRAIGDAAPGSEATTADMFTLTWVSADKELLVFADAPPGIYSLIRAQVVSWDVEGTLNTASEDNVPFRISDVPPTSVSISVPINVTLANDDFQIVRIDVELGDVVNDIEWDDAPMDDGTLVIDAMDEHITDIREHLEDAFDLHD